MVKRFIVYKAKHEKGANFRCVVFDLLAKFDTLEKAKNFTSILCADMDKTNNYIYIGKRKDYRWLHWDWPFGFVIEEVDFKTTFEKRLLRYV